MTDNKAKILIIEDEALVARELRSRLSNMGYEVVGVAYDSGGVELARNTLPDLLLTDIHLKDGEDGIEVAHAIQRERDVPVVFLTAYSDDTTVSRAKAVAPYGYIIKPVENRELQIAIEMALYKFNIERELRETQQLLQNALACIGTALVFIGEDGLIDEINTEALTLLEAAQEECVGRSWQEVLGVDQQSSLGQKVTAGLRSNDVTKLAPFILGRGRARSMLVDGVIGPMEPGAVLIIRSLSRIDDALEAPPSPEEALAHVEHDRLAPSESSMCQLLVAVDAKTGPGQPDIDRLTALLNQMLRATDLVSRYGENQLSVSMPYTSLADGQQIAESILSALKRIDAGQETVFSMGLASTAPGEQEPLELFRRASAALNIARESRADRVILWTENAEPPITSEGRRHREYQNLVLLWNVMNVVVKARDKEDLAERLCWHLRSSYSFSRVALLERHGDSISAIAGVVAEKKTFDGVTDLALSQEDIERVRSIGDRKKSRTSYGTRYLFLIEPEYVLYIDAQAAIEHSDYEFLQTLISYSATAFSRYAAFDTAPANKEPSQLLYRSPQMESIIESVRLVAPTDATVLIVGESGTGKGQLAVTIHEESRRRNKPFITVDCGAVATSLIESELFGHVRGAFTGADRNFSGRLKEAAGGSVFLDEIGDLPLDVQVKLLRFVQEHEIAAVGSTRYEVVDTRIIAATNRDLVALVEAGEFRQDLFYRLNVFTIDTPPLRERSEDILLLARHYLGEYAAQYDKRIDGFTPEAELALSQQDWPGNVRELMNVINRAVILCRDSLVSNIHLGFFPRESDQTILKTSIPTDLDAVIEKLLNEMLDTGDLIPLGQWLEEDLIAVILKANDNVLAQTAAELAIPESTLRRRVARSKEAASTRSRYFVTLETVLGDLTRRSNSEAAGLVDCLKTELLRQIQARRISRTDAAAIMGVSLPTYRKMALKKP